MDNEVNNVEGKMPYEMPKLTMISLRPEEAVLGHCKSFHGGGNNTLSGCLPIGICNSVGS